MDPSRSLAISSVALLMLPLTLAATASAQEQPGSSPGELMCGHDLEAGALMGEFGRGEMADRTPIVTTDRSRGTSLSRSDSGP